MVAAAAHMKQEVKKRMNNNRGSAAMKEGMRVWAVVHAFWNFEF